MFNSLRNRIFFIFTILLTIPFLLVSFIIPSQFIKIMERQTKDNTLEMMGQYSLYISSITSQIEDLGKQTLVNQTTREWINNVESTSGSQALLLKNQLKMQLSSMMINNSNSISISVFLNNGKGIWFDNPNLADTDWFAQFKKNDVKWVKSHIDAYQQSQEMKESHVISYLLPLYNMSTLESTGVIKVSYPSKLLENALSKIKLGEGGRVYVMDPTGQNVLSGNVETPREVLKNSLQEIEMNASPKGLIETDVEGEEYLVFYEKLRVGEWILVGEISKSELYEKINDLQKNLLWISVFIFILTIIASYLLSANIVKPLEMLRKAMRLVENGKFKDAKNYIKTIKPYKHEVGYAINVFDHTIDKLNYLIETEYEMNMRRKDAEYKALLLQINPHFMNNTLEIIGSLAAQGKKEDVINVSVDLGKMMRYSLNTKNNKVHIKEELEYIRNYTDIVKIRYEDTIEFTFMEDPLAENVEIIKFIIQPLVENAVKYSLKKGNNPKILIKTELMMNTLFILIQDNGIGMSKHIYKEIMENEYKNESGNVLNSSGTSIGLKNVIGRLKLFYGENFTFEIETEENVGTSIILCIEF